MCTAVIKKTRTGSYFLRNLDDSYYFKNELIITPKDYQFSLRGYDDIQVVQKYKIWGIGRVIDNFPLYFDCVNEHGLSFAGLAFSKLAYYREKDESKINLTPYELPLYLLGKCKTIKEVADEMKDISLLKMDFSDELKLTDLHFVMGDKLGNSLVIEPLKNGLVLYPGKDIVLTNAPTLKYQFFYLNNFLNLNNGNSLNSLRFTIPFSNYSYGLGAYGLPGDYSSCSRFVKANYLVKTFQDSKSYLCTVYNLFNILGQVSMPVGAVYREKEKAYETTVYSVVYALGEAVIYLRKFNYLDTIKINVDAYQNYQGKNKVVSYQI